MREVEDTPHRCPRCLTPQASGANLCPSCTEAVQHNQDLLDILDILAVMNSPWPAKAKRMIETMREAVKKR